MAQVTIVKLINTVQVQKMAQRRVFHAHRAPEDVFEQGHVLENKWTNKNMKKTTTSKA